MRLELVFVLCFITYLEAATLVVPTEYATIQAAINSAQSNDIVQINPGTYNEKVKINKLIDTNRTSLYLDLRITRMESQLLVLLLQIQL